MKGYLSRIARHSGLRIAGHAVRSEPVTEAAAPTGPEPLDRDEIRMVAPTADTAKSIPDRQRRTPEEGSVHRPDLPAADASEVEKRTSGPEAQTAEGTITLTERAHNEPSTDRHSGETYSESIVTPDTTSVSQETGIDRQLAPEASDFFTRTVEIIEGQSVDKDEAQTIVLREIQQWVASGSEVSASVETQVDETPATPVFEIVEEREPGVVRIGAPQRIERPEAQRHEASRPSPPAESSFELSIGTISVVIEGDDHTPPPRTRETTRPSQDASRRSSRLRRSYL